MQYENKPMRLENILNHAYTTTPFYMNRKGKKPLSTESVLSWDEIPLTKKDDVVLHGDSFISSQYLPLYLQEKLLRLHTSGSTGKCVDIYWSASENKHSLLPLWLKRKKYYQINPHDRHCYFFTGRKPGVVDIEIEDIGYALGFCKSNMNSDKLVQIWHKMQEFNPIWLALQPSMASLLCDIVENYHLSFIPNLRYVELTGEMLFTPVRERIEKVLQVKVANQYGCNEMNSIAYECPEGHLHCMEGNVFVEILDEEGKLVQEGKEGEIYLTTLTNYAMPLIRYQIGDRGRFVIHSCSCGARGKIMELTSGRNNDWVTDYDGKRLNTYIFVRCIENINKVYENAIHQFQIIQHQRGEFSVNLVVDEEWGKEDIRELFLSNLWHTSLSGAKIRFVFHSSLFPENHSGKLKWFINEMVRE